MSSHNPAPLLTPQDFEIVFVCTGNRARSPFEAELLRRHCGMASVVSTSRGLLDLEGVPALPEAVWAARRFGVDLTFHRSRALRELELASADLVIGFESQHIASAVVTGGAAKDRTFLIAELAELIGWTRGRRTRDFAPSPESVVRLAHAERGGLALLSRSVADPVGTSKDSFLATFQQIGRMVEAIGLGLFEIEGEY